MLTPPVQVFVGELLHRGAGQIKGHQKLFIAEAQAPLTESMEALQLIAHGAPNGQKWRELLAEAVPSCTIKTATKMTWKDFEMQTKNTLQKVDTREFISAIYKAHTAFTDLNERYSRFGDEMDDETHKAAMGLFHAARVTLQEAFFCEAIMTAKDDIDGATTKLQTHVANMQALPEESRIKPSDLWPWIWSTALSVQSGVVP